MTVSNDARTAVYLRDRSTLTPAQTRRVRHHANAALAEIGPARRRSARREAARLERARVGSIRARFRWARFSR